MLTGKYSRDTPPPSDSRFADVGSNPMLQRRMNDQIWDVIDGLKPLAEEKGVSLSQFALAWVVHQPGVTSPIIGPRTMEQLEDNLKALDVSISDDDRAKVDAVIPPGRMVAPYYEADFGPHQFRW